MKAADPPAALKKQIQYLNKTNKQTKNKKLNSTGIVLQKGRNNGKKTNVSSYSRIMRAVDTYMVRGLGESMEANTAGTGKNNTQDKDADVEEFYNDNPE